MQSKNVNEIRRWFGLEHCKAQEQIEIEIPRPLGGQIVMLNGPSGAGKSRLLARIKNDWTNGRAGDGANAHWLDLADVQLPDRPVVDCFPAGTLEENLLSLNRVGLAEAWDYIRTPAALSEGQKFRLKLAIALAQATKTPRSAHLTRHAAAQLPDPSILACDEFCAILDRVTARVVARTLRRTIDNQKNICAIVATSHDDLVQALQPNVLIRCDFGAAEIYQPDPPGKSLRQSCRFSRE